MVINSKSLTFNPSTIVLAMVLMMFGSSLAFASSTIKITIQDQSYQTDSGSAGAAGFTLMAGEENVIILENKDQTDHAFVSKIFTDMEVDVSGDAEKIKDGTATGWRIEPGKSIKLTFTPPVQEEFSGSWDVFYCTIHGKDKMMGEVVIADTRVGPTAF